MNNFFKRWGGYFLEIKLLSIRARFMFRGFILKKGFIREKPLEKQKIKYVRVGDYKILANKFHTIEHNLNIYKNYSKNLPRIILEVLKKYETCSIIDIGANIGDTVALIRTAGINNRIFCIEGLDYYYDLLLRNLINFDNVFPYNVFLGDSNKDLSLKIDVKSGTARILSDFNVNKTNIITLDDFVKNNSINDVKIVKIDTDGYDFKIIRGGINFIKKNNPIIFFEYDEVYLSSIKEDGIKTLQHLAEIGYNKIMYYDNFGNFLCSTTLNNLSLLKQLYGYIKNRSGAFPYYDICVFHENDNELADQIIRTEGGY